VQRLKYIMTDDAIILHDLEQTATLGRRLAGVVGPGDVIALYGDIGTGKTTLVRQVLTALGHAGEVPSPTFNLLQQYDVGGLDIWHFDLYRLKTAIEALELGLEDAFADGVSFIEWPDHLGALLPAERLNIDLALGAETTERRVKFSATKSWAARLPKLTTGPEEDG
jgi:tRNA threonylcarbamoyladenosine biosynthesis protein TsaE